MNDDRITLTRRLLEALPRCRTCGEPATHMVYMVGGLGYACAVHEILGTQAPWAAAARDLRAALDAPVSIACPRCRGRGLIPDGTDSGESDDCDVCAGIGSLDAAGITRLAAERDDATAKYMDARLEADRAALDTPAADEVTAGREALLDAFFDECEGWGLCRRDSTCGKAIEAAIRARATGDEDGGGR
jgi:hypothetical protein